MHPLIVVGYLIYLGVSVYFTYIAGKDTHKLWSTTFYGDYPLSPHQIFDSLGGIGLNGITAFLLASVVAPHRKEIVDGIFAAVKVILRIKDSPIVDNLQKSADSAIGAVLTGQIPLDRKQLLAKAEQLATAAGKAALTEATTEVAAGQAPDVGKILQSALDQLPFDVSKIMVHMKDGTVHQLAPTQYAVLPPPPAPAPVFAPNTAPAAAVSAPASPIASAPAVAPSSSQPVAAPTAR